MDNERPLDSLDTSRYGDITRVEIFVVSNSYRRCNYRLPTYPKKILPLPSDLTSRLLQGDWFRVYPLDSSALKIS